MKDIDWSELDQQPSQEPLDAMLSDYNNFKATFICPISECVWQAWINE